MLSDAGRGVVGAAALDAVLASPSANEAAIDVVIIQAVAWVVGAAAVVAGSMVDPSPTLQTIMIAAGPVVAALWSAGYFVFFWSTTGQTPGDRVMQIRVQDATDGQPLHFARTVLRLLGALLSVLLLFLGYLLILVDGRCRALHDRLVGSVVVYTPLTRRAVPSRARG